MRKKLSKIIATLFIVMMVLGQSVVGLAADNAIQPEKGDLTIHKYWAETAAEIGNEGDGTELPDGTPTNPAVKGIQFDVYLLTPKVTDPKTPDTPPSDKDGWTYSRNSNELTVTKGSIGYGYTLTLKTADSAFVDGKTNADGELKYSELPAGYYYVEENLAASTGYQVQGNGNEDKNITSAAKPFIVAVPMTTPDGEGWNDDVHVYPKNQGLTPEKKPNKPSVNVGDEVEWTITANVPSDIADYTQFDIIDELDKRLNFVFDTSDIDASVIVTGVDASSRVIVTLVKTDDYTVTRTAATASDKEKIVISLSPAGIAKLAATSGVEKISVSFKTTVNGNITSDLENVIENTADIEFENDSNPDGEKVTTPPSEVNTGEIFIDKKAADGTTNLAGAEFKLALTEADASDGKYLKVKLDATNKYIVDILKEGENGYDTAYPWVVRPHETDSAKLGLQSGVFYATSFEGLQTHTVSGTTTTWNSYWVVETKAPSEYNLLGSPVEVTFKDGLTSYVLSETVINKKGFLLPNTGGVGSVILVVVGIALVGFAIIISMNKKKKTA